MTRLARRGIIYVMIGGGSEIITSVLKEKIVDKVALFYGPKIIGGRSAPSLVMGEGVKRLRDAMTLKNVTRRSLGDDFLLEGYVRYS